MKIASAILIIPLILWFFFNQNAYKIGSDEEYLTPDHIRNTVVVKDVLAVEKDQVTLAVGVETPPSKEYLRQRCAELGLPFELLDRIVQCESTWRMVGNPFSSAFGYFQIIDGTERGTPQYAEGLRKTDPITNIEMGLFLYQKHGTSPWLASKNCWQ